MLVMCVFMDLKVRLGCAVRAYSDFSPFSEQCMLMCPLTHFWLSVTGGNLTFALNIAARRYAAS